jgi:Flp pilus assembly protein TadB
VTGWLPIAACAALGAAGLLLLVTEVSGRHQVTSRPRRPGGPSHRDGALRAAGIILAAVLAWVITGWPVAALAAAIGVGLGPRVLSNRAEKRRIERIEALEQWCRQLADTLTGAAGLEQALRASAREAPEPVRAQVQSLARRLDSGIGTEDALRMFAGEITDPVADMIAAALILAIQAHGHGLADMLTRLARTVARDVAAQREIDAERAGHRTTARWVAVILAGYTAFAVIDRTYVAPFRTLTGQLVLALVAALYGMALWWLHRLASPPAPSLFLGQHPRRRS